MNVDAGEERSLLGPHCLQVGLVGMILALKLRYG